MFGQIGLKIGRKLVNFSRDFSRLISREKCEKCASLVMGYDQNLRELSVNVISRFTIYQSRIIRSISQIKLKNRQMALFPPFVFLKNVNMEQESLDFLILQTRFCYDLLRYIDSFFINKFFYLRLFQSTFFSNIQSILLGLSKKLQLTFCWLITKHQAL